MFVITGFADVKTAVEAMKRGASHYLQKPLDLAELRAVVDKSAERVRTVREGGTGSASEHAVQPQFMPDKYEPGSHNATGIIGLSAGVKWASMINAAAPRANSASGSSKSGVPNSWSVA